MRRFALNLTLAFPDLPLPARIPAAAAAGVARFRADFARSLNYAAALAVPVVYVQVAGLGWMRAG